MAKQFKDDKSVRVQDEVFSFAELRNKGGTTPRQRELLKKIIAKSKATPAEDTRKKAKKALKKS